MPQERAAMMMAALGGRRSLPAPVGGNNGTRAEAATVETVMTAAAGVYVRQTLPLTQAKSALEGKRSQVHPAPTSVMLCCALQTGGLKSEEDLPISLFVGRWKKW
jgi:hypothetical protein